MPKAGISTHTLTWSVTLKRTSYVRNLSFQLTRSRGAWRKNLRVWYKEINFNSHAHVERDNAGEEVKVRFVNFNSQAHVERDQGMERRIIMTKISTHTLTWSVTRSSAGRPDRTEYFNSHAHVERDRLVRSARLCKIISTHTLTWSVTVQISRD